MTATRPSVLFVCVHSRPIRAEIKRRVLELLESWPAR